MLHVSNRAGHQQADPRSAKDPGDRPNGDECSNRVATGCAPDGIFGDRDVATVAGVKSFRDCWRERGADLSERRLAVVEMGPQSEANLYPNQSVARTSGIPSRSTTDSAATSTEKPTAERLLRQIHNPGFYSLRPDRLDAVAGETRAIRLPPVTHDGMQIFCQTVQHTRDSEPPSTPSRILQNGFSLTPVTEW